MPFSDTEASDEPAVAPAPPDHTVPPIGRRLSGVLLEPTETFRALEGSWGLLAPCLLVAAAGLVFALVHFVKVDSTALARAKGTYAVSFLSDQERRAYAQAEQTVDVGKWGGFTTNMSLLLGPTVGTLLRVVFVGLILFAGSATLGGKKDLLKAIVLSAHAKLVSIVGYGACTVALLLGAQEPATSLRNAADEIAAPVASALLEIVDPIAVWHTVLIAIGLVAALGVRPRRAAGLATAITVTPWLLGVLAASLMHRS